MNTLRTARPSKAQQQLDLQRQHSQTLQQLRRSHEELDHFVRALSHDMSANFMLLEDSFSRLKQHLGGPLDEVMTEAVAHVDACLHESKRFLDDLVGLAKTGNMQMEPSAVDIGRVVEEVLFEQQELLKQRDVRVEIRRPLPAVWCNEHRLKQVLTNLIRNAVKHGCHAQDPHITISSAENWTGRAGSAGQRLAAIRVYDNGPGIDPRFHEEIFLPGRRLPHAVGEGSGMGLAIAKKVVEYYGGSIRVDAACHDGTAMVFLLPVPPENVSTPQPASGPQIAGGPPGRCLGHDAPHEEQPPHRHQPISQRWNPRNRPWET